MAYKRITYDVRLQIERMYNVLGMNAVKISQVLGYSNPAIYYELKRGFYMHLNGEDWTQTRKYSADIAQRSAHLSLKFEF